MLTGYPLSCTLGRSVLRIGSGVARFLMTAEYATYRYLRCVVNVMLLLSQLSFSLKRGPHLWAKISMNLSFGQIRTSQNPRGNTAPK